MDSSPTAGLDDLDGLLVNCWTGRPGWMLVKWTTWKDKWTAWKDKWTAWKDKHKQHMKVNCRKLKRDGQHETPQAPPSGGSQSAPTARALRLERRNAAKLKAQASTIEKYNTTKNTNFSVSSEKFVLNQTQILTEYKTSSSSLRTEQHHRACPEFISDQPTSPLGDVLSTDLLHQNRNTNNSDLKRLREKPINFPSPNDPVWSKINDELRVALPRVFSNSIMNNMEISKLNRKIDRWLHAFFLQRFGEIPPKSTKVSRRKKGKQSDGPLPCAKEERPEGEKSSIESRF